MKNKLTAALLLFASTFMALFAVEIAIRIYFGDYSISNYVTVSRELIRSSGTAELDKYLGWIPKPGAIGQDNEWGKKVTILNNGVRSNGAPEIKNNLPSENPVILAVGDSFTFGAEVSDHETYPALLEEILQRKVINAGVFAYGIDQSFLRAKDLIQKYSPGLLIFSFIPDDINRCELSERANAIKPYFDIENDDLVLMNHPIPEKKTDKNKTGALKSVLGYSLLVHTIMKRHMPHYWLEGRKSIAHNKGVEVSCLIMQKLADMSRESGIKILVLAQHTVKPRSANLKKARHVMNCVDRSTVHVLDLAQPLKIVKEEDPDQYKRFFTGHMTHEGNTFVANELASYIEAEQL